MSKTNHQVAYAALPAVDEGREMTEADFKSRGEGQTSFLKKIGVCAALLSLLLFVGWAHCGSCQQQAVDSLQRIPGLKGIRDSFALPGPHRDPHNHHHVLDGPHRNGPLISKRHYNHDDNMHSTKNPPPVLDGPYRNGPLHHNRNNNQINYMMAKDEFRHDVLPAVFEYQGLRHSKNTHLGKNMNVENGIIRHPGLVVAGPVPHKQHALPEDDVLGSLYHNKPHHFPGASGQSFPRKANHLDPPKQHALPDDMFAPPHHQRHFPNGDWEFHHPVQKNNNNDNNDNHQEGPGHHPIDHDQMEAEIEKVFLEVEMEHEQDEREEREEDP